MKNILTLKVLVLLNFLTLLPFIVNADVGGAGPGGGYHILVDGKWVLIDNIERKNNIDFTRDPYKDHDDTVKIILEKIKKAVPQFANELNDVLKKNWYILPNKIKCEEHGSVINQTKIEAGACQFDNEIFVQDEKYNADPVGLIMHELTQGIRLEKNKSRSSENKITPIEVRGLKVAVDSFMDLEQKELEVSLVRALKAFNFGDYMTYSQQQNNLKAKDEKRKAEIEKAKAIKDLIAPHDALEKETFNLHRKNCLKTFNDGMSEVQKAQLFKGIFEAVESLDQYISSANSLINNDKLSHTEINSIEFYKSEAIEKKAKCFNTLFELNQAIKNSSGQ